MFEYLVASLLAWEGGFDQEGRWLWKGICHLYKAILLTAQSVVIMKPEIDIQAQKATYWDILAKSAEIHMLLRQVLSFEECEEIQEDSFRDIDLALIVAAADGDVTFMMSLLSIRTSRTPLMPPCPGEIRTLQPCWRTTAQKSKESTGMPGMHCIWPPSTARPRLRGPLSTQSTCSHPL